jgi:hypothetical protein
LEHSAVTGTPHDIRHVLAAKTTKFLSVGHVVCGVVLIILGAAGARGIGVNRGLVGGSGPSGGPVVFLLFLLHHFTFNIHLRLLIESRLLNMFNLPLNLRKL